MYYAKCMIGQIKTYFLLLLEVHFFRMSIFSYSSHVICLSHIFLLWVFAHISMSFFGMGIFHVISMYHQQDKPFPNMLTVQSLCFNSIEQRGKYFCSIHQTFHYALHMVNLLHKGFRSRPKVNDALLISLSNPSLTAMPRIFLQII